jgi:predicted GIY-YIG superfamily endonuclease
MKVTRFYSPYIGSKTRFPARKRPGVYIIKESDKIVYVGYSSVDVYKALYRHYQVWNDTTQERQTFDRSTTKVRLIYTTANRARLLEAALINKYMPDNNSNYTNLSASEQRAANRAFFDYMDTEVEPINF